jgi:exopolysaccharide production protein ExoZ
MSRATAAGASPAQGWACAPSVLANIQALRALAALLVVFVHMKALAVMAGLSANAMNFGNCGVDVFFVISGVIMVFTAERRETRPWDFLAHRIVRITPLYWSITFAVFLTAALAPGLVHETRASLSDLVRSLLFIPYVRLDGIMEPVVFAGWTLNYEMAFYVLFALTMLARPRFVSLALCVAVIAAAAAWRAVFHPHDPIVGFYTYPIILEFAAGVAIGWTMPRLRVNRRLAQLAAAAAAVSLVGVLFGEPLLPGVNRAFASGIPAAGLVISALVLERAGWRVRSPLVLRLGDASYSIYLTHFFLAQSATLAAEALRLEGPLAIAAVSVAVMAGVCVLGLCVFAYVEKPLTRATRRVVLGRLGAGRPARVGGGAPVRPEEA